MTFERCINILSNISQICVFPVSYLTLRLAFRQKFIQRVKSRIQYLQDDAKGDMPSGDLHDRLRSGLFNADEILESLVNEHPVAALGTNDFCAFMLKLIDVNGFSAYFGIAKSHQATVYERLPLLFKKRYFLIPFYFNFFNPKNHFSRFLELCEKEVELRDSINNVASTAIQNHSLEITKPLWKHVKEATKNEEAALRHAIKEYG